MNSVRYRPELGVLVAALTIIAIGMVTVSSSSMAVSDHSYNSVLYHTVAHAGRVFIGLCLAALTYFIGINSLRNISLVLLLFGLTLCYLVFVPGLSVEVNGAARWLDLGGLVFQPYDIFKLGCILYFAHVLDRYQRNDDISGIVVTFIIVCAATLCLLMQPDFGSLTLLLGVILITTFLVFGLTRYYLYFSLLVIGGAIWLILSEPYRLERVLTMLNPWSDRYGSGFQLVQAMVAEGSGGLSGVGLGQSIQKMLYLPEAHTDFTISVMAEETGMAGVMLVILLMVYLYLKLMFISYKLGKLQKLYESHVVFIAATFIFIQFVFNIGVNYGVLPTKGITLPFMAYGGTSIVSHIVMIGMVLSAARSLGNVPVLADTRRPAAHSNILVLR